MTENTAPLPPTRLRCEHLVDPIGIDETRPRLSWEVVDPRRGARQSAYQIVVSSDGDVLWDSGRVESREVEAVYGGTPLQSRRRATWTVRTWDGSGTPSPHSDPARFEMGLLGGLEWQARPIRATVVGTRADGVASPFLRREFDVPGDVTSARLSITAFGLYEAEINGTPVTDDVYRPGWTDYRIRLPYQVYDVTALVRPGRNAIGAVLGDGWYCGHVGIGVGRQAYGDRPALVAQLVVEVAGTSEPVFVRTDRDWRWATGPILESDNYMGESYDARLELDGWATAGYDDSAWQPVELAPALLPALVASVAPPVRRTRELRPVSITEVTPGVHVVDMGQNMVGRVRLRVRGESGTEVVLRFAEWLEPDGTIHTRNLGRARATDRYVLKGGSEEVYEPRFTFHGFRYVEVTGHPGPVTPDALTGVVLHSDTPPTGELECSNELVNRLQSNITWSQRGNFLEIPTDCPQRYERLGWTGDAQVFAPTASFNFDVQAFFAKWLTDLVDAQFVGGAEDGQYPTVVPRGARMGGGPAWSDVGVIVPWVLYQRYGDRRLLERQYPSLLRWMDFLERRDAGLTPGTWRGFGDWVSLDVDPDNLLGPDDRWGGTPLDLLAAAFHAHAADLMSRIATAIGRDADAQAWRERFARLRESFVAQFVRDGRLTAQTQTAAALALRLDLVDGATRERVAADLVADVEKRGHLVTGFVGTPHLLDALTDAGRLDLAYRLLEREELPGWLFPVRNGATTIWERWDAWTPDHGFHPSGMNSFNHYAYGAVGDWISRTVGGIDVDPSGPGFERIVLHPRPGGSITWARGSFRSVRGMVRCEWRLRPGQLEVDVEVPPTATATVRLPARSAASVGADAEAEVEQMPACAQFRVDAGRYRFTVGDPIVA